MPAHLQQSVLQQLIPMLVVLSIVASLPSVRVRSRTAGPPVPSEIAGRKWEEKQVYQPNVEDAGKGEPPDRTPDYEFAYGVRDPTTGDHKDQWERRIGDWVKGVYMLEEADGTQRIVEYEAHGARGFRATVTNVDLRKGPSKHAGQQETVAHSYNMLRAASS